MDEESAVDEVGCSEEEEAAADTKGGEGTDRERGAESTSDQRSCGGEEEEEGKKAELEGGAWRGFEPATARPLTRAL
jgi:hypothetical protein